MKSLEDTPLYKRVLTATVVGALAYGGMQLQNDNTVIQPLSSEVSPSRPSTIEKNNTSITPPEAEQSEIAAKSPEEPVPNCAVNIQPLPKNGDVTKYWEDSPTTVLAPLKVETAPDSQNHSFIKVVDAMTNRTMATLFIHAAQAVETKIPVGVYQIKLAQGKEWCDFATHFGESTLYTQLKSLNQNDANFDFKLENQQVLGRYFQLKQVVNGTLETESISADEF